MAWILGYSFYRIHYQAGFWAPNKWRSQPDWVDVQFVVHDTLHYLRKQVYAGQQKDTDLPQFDLHLSRDDYQLLTRTDHSFRSQYVRTQLTYGGQSFTVRVRNRGGHFWHYNYPKKSWRIKLLGDEHIEGYREFDLIAPKTYPMWEPLLDSWATKAGIATFGTRLASLKFNNSDNGLVYFTPNLNDSLLERNGLGPGAVFGVDPEVKQFLPQRQNIPAAWEDGYKWLVLHESRANVSRQALAELIQDLKLHPREFDKKYYGKGILDGFIRQLAFNSYLGIFHTSASANVKVHWGEKTGFFTPIAWDYLWPAYLHYLYWAGHPIFAKLLTSPRFAGDLADRMHWLYQTALPPPWIEQELDRYFRKIRPLSEGDANAMTIVQLDNLYDLNVFFMLRGLNRERLRYAEDESRGRMMARVTWAGKRLSQRKLKYFISRKGDLNSFSLSCESYRACWIHDVRGIKGKRRVEWFADLNCNGKWEHREQQGIKRPILIFPAMKRISSNDPLAVRPLFPLKEAFDVDLGRIAYPFFLKGEVRTEGLEFLVSASATETPKWELGELVDTLSNDHSSHHPWGSGCD